MSNQTASINDKHYYLIKDLNTNRFFCGDGFVTVPKIFTKRTVKTNFKKINSEIYRRWREETNIWTIVPVIISVGEPISIDEVK